MIEKQLNVKLMICSNILFMDELLGNPGVTFLLGMLLMVVIVYIEDNK